MKHLLTINTLTIFLVGVLCLSQLAAVLAAPGDLDTTFAGTGKSRLGFSSGDDEANAAAVQPDGKLVVVGSTVNGGSLDFLVIRYNLDGSPDTSFGDNGKAITPVSFGDDVARAVAIQTDGKIVVAGHGDGSNDDFAVVRYNPDGSLDNSFGVGGKEITTITTSFDEGRAVAVQADGKIVVTGSSYTDNVQKDFATVRYNADGSLDNSFGNNGKVITPIGKDNNEANAIAIQPDGKIVVAGSTINDNSDSDFAVARYTTNGGLDFIKTTGFNGGTVSSGDVGRAVAIQPDGKIVVAGSTSLGVTTNFAVARYETDGQLDTSLNGTARVSTPIGTGAAVANAVMITGRVLQRIVVAGYSYNGPHKDVAIVRYNLNGSLDTLFNGTGKVTTPIGAADDEANAVVAQAGLIAVAGTSFNGANKDVAVVRYNPNGSPDTAFDGDGKRTDDVGTRFATAKGVALQPDGKVVVAGHSDTDSNGYDFAIARYNADGGLDASFDGDGKVTTDFNSGRDEGSAVAIQPDGRVVVAGSRSDGSPGSYDFAVARYNPDGSPDTSFNGNGRVITSVGPKNDFAVGVALQADGKIVVVGYTEVGPEKHDFAAVRYHPNGAPDNSFDGDGKAITPVGLGDDVAAAVRIQADGRIVVAGRSHNGSDMDFAVVRYNADGALDMSFGAFGRQITPIGTGDDVGFGMALQADGGVVVAGYSIMGTSVDCAVVRYTANGSPDTSFDGDGKVLTPIGVSQDVGTAVAVQADGKIVMAGASVIGSDLNFALARYHPDGSLDTSFGIGGKRVVDISGVHDVAWAMALDATGKAVVAGDANGLFGVTRISGGLGGGPAPAPLRITGASVSGKKLFIQGQGFEAGAVILLNDAPQRTVNDALNPAGRLIGRKAGRKIGVGATVRLKVRNADGAESAEFSYTRPAP